MRFLFDLVHPADAHVFHHVIRQLQERGHATRVVARHKDVLEDLLDSYGIPYESVGASGRKGLVGQGVELLRRDLAIGRTARDFKPHLVVTRNPSGAQAGRLLGLPTVFDTDDGRAAGPNFYLAAPFASIITTPDCFAEDYGRKHIKYRGYKELAYLHPSLFVPDENVLDELGVVKGEPFFIVRFVEMVASHDRGESGMPPHLRERLVELLLGHGRLFVSSEGPVPDLMETQRFPLPPNRLHHALAFATMVVGDSQTMAGEAAVLGTPNIRCSSWVGRLPYLEDLEHTWGLTKGFPPSDGEGVLAAVDAWLADTEKVRDDFLVRRSGMLAEKVNMAAWYVEFLVSIAGKGKR